MNKIACPPLTDTVNWFPPGKFVSVVTFDFIISVRNLWPYQFEYMFLGSGGSHFAEVQKKKRCGQVLAILNAV